MINSCVGELTIVLSFQKGRCIDTIGVLRQLHTILLVVESISYQLLEADTYPETDGTYTSVRRKSSKDFGAFLIFAYTPLFYSPTILPFREEDTNIFSHTRDLSQVQLKSWKVWGCFACGQPQMLQSFVTEIFFWTLEVFISQVSTIQHNHQWLLVS